MSQFQSTLPVGGGTVSAHGFLVSRCYFNPPSPWGERLKTESKIINISIFQSTLPVGGETNLYGSLDDLIVFQSTLPVGGETV